jgi:hypothetical protein
MAAKPLKSAGHPAICADNQLQFASLVRGNLPQIDFFSSLLVAQHALGERRRNAGASFNISSMIIQSFPDFPHAAQAARWRKTARAARRHALNHSCIEGNPTGRVSTITAGLPLVEDALPYKRKARFSNHACVIAVSEACPQKSASGSRQCHCRRIHVCQSDRFWRSPSGAFSR